MPANKPYKVLLESVIQEKKKLRSSVTYSETAPDYYTFVPVGMPDLTEYCKELSRKRGVAVKIVSELPHNLSMHDPTHISHHIHRKGHHFQTEIVNIGYIQMGYTERGHPDRNPKDVLSSAALSRRMDARGEEMGLQMHDRIEDSDRQKHAASLAIRDLFPKIPDEDRKAVITRAFEKGAGRIGEQKDIPLSRRVQLAVTAHIRHTKTNYDVFLQQMDWADARRLAERGTLDQIKQWRGEGNDDNGEFEEILEEFIVIDDGSDDEDDGQDQEENEAALRTADDARSWAQTRVSPVIKQEDLQQRIYDSKARVDFSNARERSRGHYATELNWRAELANAVREGIDDIRGCKEDLQQRIIDSRPRVGFSNELERIRDHHAAELEKLERSRERSRHHYAAEMENARQHYVTMQRHHYAAELDNARHHYVTMQEASEQRRAGSHPTADASPRNFTYLNLQARTVPGHIIGDTWIGQYSDRNAAASLTAPLHAQPHPEDVIDLTVDSPPRQKREPRDPKYQPYGLSYNLSGRRSASPELLARQRREYSYEPSAPSRQLHDLYRGGPSFGAPGLYRARGPAPESEIEEGEMRRGRGEPAIIRRDRAAPERFYETETEEREIREGHGEPATIRRDRAPVHANQVYHWPVSSRLEQEHKHWDEFLDRNHFGKS